MVPEEWQVSNFKQLSIQVVDGDRGSNYPKKSDYLDNGHCLFLGAANILINSFSLQDRVFISKEKHEKLRKGVIESDDLVIIMRGNGTGRIALYDDSIPYKIARINSGLAIIRPTKTNINRSYLVHLMRSPVITKQFLRYIFGSAQPQLTVGILNSLKLPIPSLLEQNKIDQILSTWDKAISTIENLIHNSQQQKKSLMQQLLTGKKRFPEFENEWKETRLDDVCQFKKGKGLSKSAIESEGLYKCVLYGELYTKYGEVIREVVSHTNEIDSVKSKRGDILIPSSTTTSGIDLANAVALLEDGVLLGGDINILRPDQSQVCSEFMAYLLTHIKKHEIASRAQGVTIIHLYGKDLKPLKKEEVNKLLFGK